MEGNFYRDLAYVFGAAMAGGFIAKWLRQPLILGYLLGGIAIGPFTPGVTLSHTHEFELLAEIGVMLLMYSIGLEFSFRELLKVKWIAVLGGPLGIFLSVGLSLLVGHFLAWSTQQSIAIGAVISVASTMVLSRFLMDRDELLSAHGRVMIGITLVEDLAVVVLTVLLPTLGGASGGGLWSLAIALGKAVLILIPLIFVAAKILPRIMAKISQSENDELYLLTILALGFITAAITEALGLSLALGAFLAGVLVSESDTSHKMLNKLLPLRDAFVALFFVTIGALVDPRVIIHEPALWIVIVLLTVGGKFVVWGGVVWLFRYPWRTAMLVGVGLTQIGEFSYVLVRVARDANLVGNDVYNATLAASVITIILNGLLMKAMPREEVPA
ncbi:MAG TPA: cation:proton antiporter [Terriglobales bacterium]|jgi:CPA2 family monovalent cation:H+ antiporter-2|nr:cation:proton antiporter [Terriglobales bacterium]